MHGIRKLAAVAATFAVALATIATPVSASSVTTRWVDGDGHAGPNGCGGSTHAATSIQSAVDASGPDDVVVVCPGTYVEQVRIRGHRDGLTVRTSQPFGATIKGPSHIAKPLGFGYLVLVEQVDDVSIQGFKILTRTAAPCDATDVTIGILGSRRTSIRGNRLLAPGSDGTESCSQALGIAVVNGLQNGQPGGSASSAGSATIAYNEIRDARFGGVVAFAVGGRVEMHVSHNSIRAYFGQQSAATSSISGLDGAQFGIGFLGRARGSATDNTIQGSSSGLQSGAAFFAGVAVLADVNSSPQRNGPITIRDNLIRRVVVGIQGESARDLTVRHNDVSNSYAGVAFQGTTGSTVRQNIIRSQQVGITLDSTSTGNAFRSNTLTGQGAFCVDPSAGGGTSGTANTWSGNVSALGGSPSGICATAP